MTCMKASWYYIRLYIHVHMQVVEGLWSNHGGDPRPSGSGDETKRKAAVKMVGTNLLSEAAPFQCYFSSRISWPLSS